MKYSKMKLLNKTKKGMNPENFKKKEGNKENKDQLEQPESSNIEPKFRLIIENLKAYTPILKIINLSYINIKSNLLTAIMIEYIGYFDKYR